MFCGFFGNLQKLLHLDRFFSGSLGSGSSFGKGEVSSALRRPDPERNFEHFRAFRATHPNSEQPTRISSNPPDPSKCTSRVKGRISSNPVEFRATHPNFEGPTFEFRAISSVSSGWLPSPKTTLNRLISHAK